MSKATNARKAYRQTNNGRASDAEGEFNEVTDFVIPFIKDTADASSAGASTNLPFYVTPYTIDVISVTWLAKAATTMNATSYVTLTLNKSSGATSTATMTAVAAKSTQSNTISARKKFPLTVATTDQANRVASGYCLFFNIGKTSNGKKLQPGALSVHCRRV